MTRPPVPLPDVFLGALVKAVLMVCPLLFAHAYRALTDLLAGY